jgi:phosphoenolpyruvate synthase/pyruvate phosphate dikinase
MSQLILPLQVTQADVNSIGTKAAALGALKQAGLNVPNGFVLTTSAYLEFIAPLRDKIRARLTDDIIMDPAEIESAAAEIREDLKAQSFPPPLRAALETALGSFSDAERASLIARTSTPSDDLATAFGSGVARAYLGLVGADEIERAAAKCWAALWNSRSMYYRHRKKIVQTDVALAVLVQPMIHADSAGVMFTQNPMGGGRTELQINSIWGLGAPLTGARFRPDQFLVDKVSGEIRDRTIEEQVVKLVVGEDGHIEEHGITSELVNTASLTDIQVKNLAALGKRIEVFFSAPQDIEWAIVGDEIFVLQARPMGVRTS